MFSKHEVVSGSDRISLSSIGLLSGLLVAASNFCITQAIAQEQGNGKNAVERKSIRHSNPPSAHSKIAYQCTCSFTPGCQFPSFESIEILLAKVEQSATHPRILEFAHLIDETLVALEEGGIVDKKLDLHLSLGKAAVQLKELLEIESAGFAEEEIIELVQANQMELQSKIAKFPVTDAVVSNAAFQAPPLNGATYFDLPGVVAPKMPIYLVNSLALANSLGANKYEKWLTTFSKEHQRSIQARLIRIANAAHFGMETSSFLTLNKRTNISMLVFPTNGGPRIFILKTDSYVLIVGLGYNSSPWTTKNNEVHYAAAIAAEFLEALNKGQ